MRYCIDIDGCICTNTSGAYAKALPNHDVIARVNELHDAGEHIMLYTARGTTTGIDWRKLTEKQLMLWNVKYDELRFGKPDYDVIVDDKSLSISDFIRPHDM